MPKLGIILLGRVPSKKNSKQWLKFGGRMVLVPSKEYNAWHTEKSWELKNYKKLIKKTIDKCAITIKIYFPDKRKTDLTNKAESIMDLLVDNEFLTDDNHEVCPDLHLISEGVDKDNPRVEITIIYEKE